MASKSFVFGGGDTWQPNGVIPWGENREFSLAWYEDAGVFLTQMYAYEIQPESLGIRSTLTLARVDPNCADVATIHCSLTVLDLEDTVKYTTYEWQVEPMALSQFGLTVLDLVETVKYTTYGDWQPEPLMVNAAGLMSLQMETVVVTYNDYEAEELVMPPTTLTGVTLS